MITENFDYSEYNKLEAINQTFIKKLLNDPQLISEDRNSLHFEEKDHFVFGSLVDSLLTQNRDYFKKNYYIGDLEKMNSNFKSMAHWVIDNVSDKEIEELDRIFLDIEDEFFDKLILKSYLEHNYQPRQKDPTKLTNFRKEVSNYWKALIKSDGKQVISKEQYIKAKEIQRLILESPFQIYFRNDPKNNSFYCDYINLFQTCLVGEIFGVSFKGLLDVLSIRIEEGEPDTYGNTSKTCHLKVVDLKTTTSPYSKLRFEFFQRGYDIQACIYTELLRVLLPQILKKLGLNEEDFDSITIEEPVYVFIHSSAKYSPVALEISMETLEGVKHGRENKHEKATRWKGLISLIKEFKEYYSVEGYNLPYEFRKRNTIKL